MESKRTENNPRPNLVGSPNNELQSSECESERKTKEGMIDHDESNKTIRKTNNAVYSIVTIVCGRHCNVLIETTAVLILVILHCLYVTFNISIGEGRSVNKSKLLYVTLSLTFFASKHQTLQVEIFKHFKHIFFSDKEKRITERISVKNSNFTLPGSRVPCGLQRAHFTLQNRGLFVTDFECVKVFILK